MSERWWVRFRVWFLGWWPLTWRSTLWQERIDHEGMEAWGDKTLLKLLYRNAEVARLNLNVQILERALSNLYCAAISLDDLYIAPPESWKSQALMELTEEQARKEVSE